MCRFQRHITPHSWVPQKFPEKVREALKSSHTGAEEQADKIRLTTSPVPRESKLIFDCQLFCLSPGAAAVSLKNFLYGIADFQPSHRVGCRLKSSFLLCRHSVFLRGRRLCARIRNGALLLILPCPSLAAPPSAVLCDRRCFVCVFLSVLAVHCPLVMDVE